MTTTTTQKNLKQILFFGYLLCFMHFSAFAQNDSLQFLLKNIGNSNVELRTKSMHQIYELAKKQDNQDLMDFYKKSLETLAKAGISPSLLDDILYNFSEQSKERQLEQSFILMLLTLENNPDFSNPELQLQLQYYYASYFFILKEYYYAEKFCNLYLENLKKAPSAEEHSKQILNMMNVSALIDQEQNKLDQAIEKFKITIDSAKAKKEDAWVGISSGNLAYCLFLGRKYDEAIPLFEKDIQLSKITFQLGSAINSEIVLAEIYHALKDNQKAFEYADSAKKQLALLTSINPNNYRTYMGERFQVSKILGKLYYQKRDLTKANDFLYQAVLLEDSLKQLNKAGEFKSILQEIQFDKQMVEVAELNSTIKQKQLQLNQIILIAIILTLTLIAILFLVRKISKANKNLNEKNGIINDQNHSLEKINADKDRLFSIISHDLRGPASTIQALMKAFSEKRIPLQDFETLLPGIVKNTNNLSNTLDNLLTWSMSKNGIQLVPEQLNINQCIQENLALVEEQMSLKKITTQNNCPEFDVFADKNHLDVILRNLLNNAIKFSYPNAIIEIDGFDHGDKIEIRILDHGLGMSSEQLQKINNNEVFKSATGTSGEKGSGLGLQLVKDFVEKNGGRFYIESKEKFGTTMCFTIPKF
jgi:signal transduction histidine kinase